MTENEQKERRQYKRASLIKDVKISGIGVFQCLNLSVGGMYLEAMTPYYGGQELLEMQFILKRHIINVHGRVIYNHNPRGVGVTFLDLKPEDRSKIENLIGILGDHIK